MSSQQVCYICQEDSGEMVDTPCECKGTQGQVHADCLKAMRARPEFASFCRQCLSPWTDVEPQFLSYPLLFVSKCEVNVVQALAFYALFPVMQWLFANRLLAFLGSSLCSQALRRVMWPSFHECVVPTPTLWYSAAWAQSETVLVVTWALVRSLLWLVGVESETFNTMINWMVGCLLLSAVPIVAELVQRMLWFTQVQQRWSNGVPYSQDLLLVKQFKEATTTALDSQARELLTFWERYLVPIAIEATVLIAQKYDPKRFAHRRGQESLRTNYWRLFRAHPQLSVRTFKFSSFLESATSQCALLPWPAQSTPTYVAWCALGLMTACCAWMSI
jgi:hypothetical protein